jgi:hypothetical protein
VERGAQRRQPASEQHQSWQVLTGFTGSLIDRFCKF